MRYSKQRDTVYEIVQSNPRHLSAEEVWELSKVEIPSIGFATVYRNLNALVQMGLVRRIKSVDGVDHFDACVMPHAHFICTHCAKVYDSVMSYQDVMEKIRMQSGENVEDVEIFIKGVCKDCQIVHNSNER
ncbi:MAG: transcriptional repressor, partial [Erysipelotrichales bacterium]|nr:transcriptional repressor [Erysipelotrichales bacterium]MBR3693604.1 transcriptional repressor [Erysipelotrichales bacterium]